MLGKRLVGGLGRAGRISVGILLERGLLVGTPFVVVQERRVHVFGVFPGGMRNVADVLRIVVTVALELIVDGTFIHVRLSSRVTQPRPARRGSPGPFPSTARDPGRLRGIGPR